ncbi:uncharacterized protein C8Q71DRAFT_852880 [Rhodofomes roseus]|uniref:Uncharacterized protein n=1 Tax=Rhodofomes roseus TaxID=34475 RepID=A0ABQ8KTC4_9APHY|nr:uncharacterized protein C8Q71DRAFT_852880 [Rhodofomes roseus]KAH9842310.1 hypothetical protein C8Q71DRAFT_852880 [Rhodofomes roseus]
MARSKQSHVTGTPSNSLDLVNLDWYLETMLRPAQGSTTQAIQQHPILFREWHTSNLLTIAGRGIPVKHWDKVYKKRSGVVETDAWHALRVEWGNWKFLAEERDRFSSEDAFWDKLQKDRTWTDAADYDAAMRYFGGDLGRSDTQGVFRYKKSGKWRICDKKLTVAKKWRALLEKDETIRAKLGSHAGCKPVGLRTHTINTASRLLLRLYIHRLAPFLQSIDGEFADISESYT